MAATNRDLRAMMRTGEFRQDLFYRLDVFPITLPSLRQRASDVPHLARHLISEIFRRLTLTQPEISPRALDLLAAQPWPGNVRQLANVLERAIILGEGGVIRHRQLAPLLLSGTVLSERQRIRQALAATDGDKRRTAEKLGISYRTLQRKISQFDLEGFPRYRS